jgi:acyl-CoA synthetase (NDP forming)
MIERQETIASLKTIFNARSLAVVGVSSDPQKDGYKTLETVIGGGYEGRLYPVNPKGGRICGVDVYPSVRDLPDQLDAVVIIVRADLVPEVMRESAAKGAKGVVILSGGFRESGRADLEGEIFKVAREHGMRIMGPNIQGINYPPNKMCAMMFPVIKTKGPLGIVSQSGTVTTALSEWADREGFGISAAINLGNQVDLCESDYLDFFTEDENTRAIVMYLESVKDGRRFLGALEIAASKKPVAILKSGRTTAGAKAAASHTGSMAGNHEIFCAACRQYGGLPVENLTTLYDSAKGMAAIRPPKGKRVLAISTSGGMATLSTDEAASRGLIVPPLPIRLKKELEELDLFSPLATLSNPMDLVELIGEHFLQAARLADRFHTVDAILICFGDPVADGIDVVKTLAAELQASLAVSYMGGGEEELRSTLELHKSNIPVFPSPERALAGIGAAVWREQYRSVRGLG